MGMVIFLATAGTIYQNLAIKKVGNALPHLQATDITNLVAGTSSQMYKELSQREKDLITPAVTDAMSNVWLFFLVAGALSFVLTLFLGVSGSRFSFLIPFLIRGWLLTNFSREQS